MADKGPAKDDNGDPVKVGDLVTCLYKILEDSKVVDCAWVEGAVSRIDYDFGYHSYYVNFKFEGKDMRTCFDAQDVNFRDRPPKTSGAKAIPIKEMLEDKGEEIFWNDNDFNPSPEDFRR